jgi:hypothetical protein
LASNIIKKRINAVTVDSLRTFDQIPNNLGVRLHSEGVGFRLKTGLIEFHERQARYYAACTSDQIPDDSRIGFDPGKIDFKLETAITECL